MTRTLHVTIDTPDGPVDRNLTISRLYNLGFTLRDTARMQRHLDQGRQLGIHLDWPERLPIIAPVAPWAAVTDDEVTVQFDTTSGEVEIVTVVDGTEVLVGVGSDHTDRALEATDILRSKQVAPNVLAPHLWRWVDVRDHWDEVRLESYVRDGSTERLYQRASVSEFWTPQEMIDRTRPRIADIAGAYVLFSGTIETVSEHHSFSRWFSVRMIDGVLGREIRHDYQVLVLADEISE